MEKVTSIRYRRRQGNVVSVIKTETIYDDKKSNGTLALVIALATILLCCTIAIVGIAVL